MALVRMPLCPAMVTKHRSECPCARKCAADARPENLRRSSAEGAGGAARESRKPPGNSSLLGPPEGGRCASLYIQCDQVGGHVRHTPVLLGIRLVSLDFSMELYSREGGCSGGVPLMAPNEGGSRGFAADAGSGSSIAAGLHVERCLAARAAATRRKR
jgi:hypothetical protein